MMMDTYKLQNYSVMWHMLQKTYIHRATHAHKKNQVIFYTAGVTSIEVLRLMKLLNIL